MQVSAGSLPSFSRLPGAGLDSQLSSSKASDERIQQAHQLQNTFTAVLAQFGREGYTSATPVAADTPLDATIDASWSEWFDHCGRSAYRDLPATNTPPASGQKRLAPAEKLMQDYGQILLDAYNEGGYVNATAFLQTLTSDQLDTVQTIHRLANPIDVAQLQEEGAINLLIPPAAQVDFNGDGLTQVGIGQMIRFPDSSTSTEVRDAWEEATADLSPMERSHYAMQMKLPTLTANIHADSNGRFLHRAQPGDADWTNPMASATYSFLGAVQDRLDYLDTFKNQIPADQYLRDQQFWSKFGSQLKMRGAA
jgi:hypothetical protein